MVPPIKCRQGSQCTINHKKSQKCIFILSVSLTEKGQQSALYLLEHITEVSTNVMVPPIKCIQGSQCTISHKKILLYNQQESKENSMREREREIQVLDKHVGTVAP